MLLACNFIKKWTLSRDYFEGFTEILNGCFPALVYRQPRPQCIFRYKRKAKKFLKIDLWTRLVYSEILLQIFLVRKEPLEIMVKSWKISYEKVYFMDFITKIWWGEGKYTSCTPSFPGIGLKRHTFNIKHYLHKRYLRKKFILAYIRMTKLLKKNYFNKLIEERGFVELSTKANHLRASEVYFAAFWDKPLKVSRKKISPIPMYTRFTQFLTIFNYTKSTIGIITYTLTLNKNPIFMCT